MSWFIQSLMGKVMLKYPHSEMYSVLKKSGPLATTLNRGQYKRIEVEGNF